MFLNLLFKLQNHYQCLAWKEFYGDDAQHQTISYRITRNSPEQIKIDATTTNVYVYRCLFTNCSSTTEINGGVLSFTKKDGKLLIEFSIFEDCHSQKYGGVVYARTDNSDCVINNVCSYKCYAKIEGQFIYSSLQYSKQNSVLSSSICSTYDVYGERDPIYFQYGSQKCHSVNISNYNVTWYSAILYNFATTISNITYCSIVSNNAVNHNCVFLSSSSSSYFIESCNIVNNTQQDKDSGGTIYCCQYTYVNHSNLIGNEATYLFYLTGSYLNLKVTIDDTYIQYIDEKEDKLWTNNPNYSATLTTKQTLENPTEIELEFIDCFSLKQKFRITKCINSYIFFLNFLRASLFPSIYL